MRGRLTQTFPFPSSDPCLINNNGGDIDVFEGPGAPCPAIPAWHRVSAAAESATAKAPSSTLAQDSHRRGHRRGHGACQRLRCTRLAGIGRGVDVGLRPSSASPPLGARPTPPRLRPPPPPPPHTTHIAAHALGLESVDLPPLNLPEAASRFVEERAAKQQKALDSAEASFQDSDLLATLKQRSQDNQSKCAVGL